MKEVKMLAGRLKSELRAGLKSMAPNMYFNPDRIEDRLYSKAEVCHILEKWGHQSIPIKYRKTNLARTLSPVKATHVTFRFKDEAEPSCRKRHFYSHHGK